MARSHDPTLRPCDDVSAAERQLDVATVSPRARDQELIDGWRRGSWDDGLELMRQYYRFFLSLCVASGIQGDEERIDVFHDLVLRIHRVLPTLVIERSFAAYLRRVFATCLRERNRHRFDSMASDDIVGRERSPLDALEREEVLEAILDCSERLDEREQALFHARHFQEERLVDIASRHGLGLDHLYVLYHRIRSRMVACLELKGHRL